MILTKEQQAILDGEKGETLAKVMKTMVMYGEAFDIPNPEDVVFMGWFNGGEVFRSGCLWDRGNGKIFYFQPGHETFPTYKVPEVQTIITNAVRYVAPTYRQNISCPHVRKITDDENKKAEQDNLLRFFYLLYLSTKLCIATTNFSSSVNVVSSGSPSLIRIVLRISFGITTRPRSSILLTIPVAFIVSRTPLIGIVGTAGCRSYTNVTICAVIICEKRRFIRSGFLFCVAYAMIHTA